MELWNIGTIGVPSGKKKYGSWEKQTMDRKSLDSNTEVMRF
jgi:hypothetical protein